jgi:hypothetical protein
MEHPRKKISPQKVNLIQRLQRKNGWMRFRAPHPEYDADLKQTVQPASLSQDLKHELPTQGTLHRRHK